MKLKDKVAIVTGAGRGIGREIALTLSNQGANLVIVDIDKNNLEDAYRKIKELGRNIIKFNVDISKSADVRGLVDKTLQDFKRIDILVNNAVYVKYGKFLEFQEDEWDRVIDVGLKGYFLCAQAVGREMAKNRSGKIINIASVTGELGFQNSCAYSSSKGGVIALTRVIAIELAPYGINVNAISPGPTDTGGLMSILSQEDVDERLRRIPLGRFGTSGDIAKAALFLASEESSYITGHILKVDGGFTVLGIHRKDQLMNQAIN